ncbi:hypothetical protein BT63DRAFT_424010 [Microthyrium microscopicum]|uniref:Uncharacterized protein n=1 Tax=Microthyrium microscopicum TaxID=703497 RepID=A0A6A6UER2_9PEZI|nr:hypothetical protein BT63DRAFT_424010 [Microthyrium microscopicum]
MAYTAARFGYFRIVEYLLSRNLIDIEDKDAEGYTLLCLAARFGHCEVVEMLLTKGANPCLRVAAESGDVGESIDPTFGKDRWDQTRPQLHDYTPWDLALRFRKYATQGAFAFVEAENLEKNGQGRTFYARSRISTLKELQRKDKLQERECKWYHVNGNDLFWIRVCANLLRYAYLMLEINC